METGILGLCAIVIAAIFKVPSVWLTNGKYVRDETCAARVQALERGLQDLQISIDRLHNQILDLQRNVR